ncbi:hypothetical protein [Achromobacter xylosoxidans]|uniref:Uncharacterized protein n=1 Tax=Alcaligenes xylosoxydans xylosoxydans TaxID=85698 RepID=A0A1R1JM00_ALCXX|nr:hypothetical protein [Achromobacter xylosoxidans]OMG78314.1 hypothetical protein BIZ92_32980 [Achromobacter xylosoxidans]BEG74475.1 hypothetical protein HBIAX_01522 [Achromobacter xylosoxidans]CUJ51925.1 Uncharacterised protein [Achromobacter xylosoxidans]
MKIFDQEHYDLMIQFEREHSGRFDREAKEFWPKGIVYQDGRINELFLTYRRGYAFCEADMRSDIQNLEASRDGYRSDAQRDSQDAALWRAYAARFPEVSTAFVVVHGDVAAPGDATLPTIKGAAITGGYVIVTPAGWDSDKATKVRDAILRLFPVNRAHTPPPSAAQPAQQGAGE